jgi:EpsI family protein
MQIGNDPFVARTTLLRSTKQRLMAMDWSWISGRRLSDPYLGKLLLARERLLGLGDPAIGVIVATPYEDRAELASATLQQFSHDVLPSIERSIQGAWQN